MDKVTAAMVLTSLSTSPLVRSPPVQNGKLREGSSHIRSRASLEEALFFLSLSSSPFFLFFPVVF